MNYKYGTKADDIFYGSAGTDVFYGRAGNDAMYTDLDASTPYAQDRFYGEAGNDTFEVALNHRVVAAISHDDLAKPVINGGSGRDHIIFDYDGRGNIDLADLAGTTAVRNIERFSYNFSSFAGTISGHNAADTISASTTGKTAILAGNGDNLVTVFARSAGTTVKTGNGDDTLAATYFVGEAMATVTSGTGNDVFYFNDFAPFNVAGGRLAQGMRITDFDTKRDHFLIDIRGIDDGGPNAGWDYFPAGHHSAKAFREHIDFDRNTGVLLIDGHRKAVIMGELHLSADDFLFF